MQLKRLDPNQKIYHLFKLSTILYALYDDRMDLPIQYGSLNKMQPTIDSVKTNIKGSFIIFYDRDLNDGFTFKKNQMKTRINNGGTEL